jgi:hypothetical protein
VRRAVAQGLAALRRSPRATSTAHGMRRAHGPRVGAMNPSESERDATRATSCGPAQ